MTQDLVVYLIFIAYAVGMLMTFGTLLTWVERKQAAVMSDRIGANRAYVRIPFTQFKLVWWGLFHGIADGIKMLVKEDFKPRTYDWYAYAVAMLMTFGTVLTWVERKQAAVMSDRIGANRAYIRLPFTQIKLIWLGLFHGLADGLKMMLKEDFRPITYDRLAYAIAPWVVFVPVLLVFAVIPFGGTNTTQGAMA